MGKWFLYNGDTLYRCFSCQQGTCIVRFAKILAVNELVIKYFHYVKLNFIHPIGLQDVLELFDKNVSLIVVPFFANDLPLTSFYS